MADSEFLTVTTYRDAAVPEWIAISHSADTYYGDDVRRAFKEGVEAALNIECKGECAKPLATVVSLEDPEPARNSRLADVTDDIWRFEEDDEGNYGWRYANTMRSYPWSQVTRGWDGYFPMTRVG